jgi:hypothetical protein
MSRTVDLVHPHQILKVAGGVLTRKCTLFLDDPALAASPYSVRAPVSVADFCLFVSALEGKDVDVTNDNVRGLSLLCDEFGFQSLSERLSSFRQSADFNEVVVVEDSEARLRLSALEERLLQRDDEFEALRQEQKSTAASLTAAVESWRQSVANGQSCLEKAMKGVTADVGALSRAVSTQQEQTQKKFQTQERSLNAADVRLSQVRDDLERLGGDLRKSLSVLQRDDEFAALRSELARQSRAQESTAASLTAAVALKRDVEQLAAVVRALQSWRQSVENAPRRLGPIHGRFLSHDRDQGGCHDESAPPSVDRQKQAPRPIGKVTDRGRLLSKPRFATARPRHVTEDRGMTDDTPAITFILAPTFRKQAVATDAEKTVWELSPEGGDVCFVLASTEWDDRNDISGELSTTYAGRRVVSDPGPITRSLRFRFGEKSFDIAADAQSTLASLRSQVNEETGTDLGFSFQGHFLNPGLPLWRFGIAEDEEIVLGPDEPPATGEPPPDQPSSTDPQQGGCHDESAPPGERELPSSPDRVQDGRRAESAPPVAIHGPLSSPDRDQDGNQDESAPSVAAIPGPPPEAQSAGQSEEEQRESAPPAVMVYRFTAKNRVVCAFENPVEGDPDVDELLEALRRAWKDEKISDVVLAEALAAAEEGPPGVRNVVVEILDPEWSVRVNDEEPTGARLPKSATLADLANAVLPGKHFYAVERDRYLFDAASPLSRLERPIRIFEISRKRLQVELKGSSAGAIEAVDVELDIDATVSDLERALRTQPRFLSAADVTFATDGRKLKQDEHVWATASEDPRIHVSVIWYYYCESDALTERFSERLKLSDERLRRGISPALERRWNLQEQELSLKDPPEEIEKLFRDAAAAFSTRSSETNRIQIVLKLKPEFTFCISENQIQIAVSPRADLSAVLTELAQRNSLSLDDILWVVDGKCIFDTSAAVGSCRDVKRIEVYEIGPKTINYKASARRSGSIDLLVTATGADVQRRLLEDPFFKNAKTIDLFYKGLPVQPETKVWSLCLYTDDLTLTVDATRPHRILARRKSGALLSEQLVQRRDSEVDAEVSSDLFKAEWTHGFERLPEKESQFDRARELAGPEEPAVIEFTALDPEFTFILPDRKRFRARIDERTPVFVAVTELKGENGTSLISDRFYLRVGERDILPLPPNDVQPLSEFTKPIGIFLITSINFSFEHVLFTERRKYKLNLPLDVTSADLIEELSKEPLLAGISFTICGLDPTDRPYFVKKKQLPLELTVTASRRYAVTLKSLWDNHTVTEDFTLTDGNVAPLNGLIERCTEQWPRDGKPKIRITARRVPVLIQSALEKNPAADPIPADLEVPLPTFDFEVYGEKRTESVHPDLELSKVLFDLWERECCVVDGRFRILGKIGDCFKRTIQILRDEQTEFRFTLEPTKDGVDFCFVVPFIISWEDLAEVLLGDASLTKLTAATSVALDYLAIPKGVSRTTRVLEKFPQSDLPLKLIADATRTYAITGERTGQKFGPVEISIADSCKDFSGSQKKLESDWTAEADGDPILIRDLQERIESARIAAFAGPRADSIPVIVPIH